MQPSLRSLALLAVAVVSVYLALGMSTPASSGAERTLFTALGEGGGPLEPHGAGAILMAKLAKLAAEKEDDVATIARLKTELAAAGKNAGKIAVAAATLSRPHAPNGYDPMPAVQKKKKKSSADPHRHSGGGGGGGGTGAPRAPHRRSQRCRQDREGDLGRGRPRQHRTGSDDGGHIPGDWRRRRRVRRGAIATTRWQQVHRANHGCPGCCCAVGPRRRVRRPVRPRVQQPTPRPSSEAGCRIPQRGSICVGISSRYIRLFAHYLVSEDREGATHLTLRTLVLQQPPVESLTGNLAFFLFLDLTHPCPPVLELLYVCVV